MESLILFLQIDGKMGPDRAAVTSGAFNPASTQARYVTLFKLACRLCYLLSLDFLILLDGLDVLVILQSRDRVLGEGHPREHKSDNYR